MTHSTWYALFSCLLYERNWNAAFWSAYTKEALSSLKTAGPSAIHVWQNGDAIKVVAVVCYTDTNLLSQSMLFYSLQFPSELFFVESIAMRGARSHIAGGDVYQSFLCWCILASSIKLLQRSPMTIVEVDGIRWLWFQKRIACASWVISWQWDPASISLFSLQTYESVLFTNGYQKLERHRAGMTELSKDDEQDG